MVRSALEEVTRSRITDDGRSNEARRHAVTILGPEHWHGCSADLAAPAKMNCLPGRDVAFIGLPGAQE